MSDLRLGAGTLETDKSAGPGRTDPYDASGDNAGNRGPAFDAAVNEIRNRFGSNAGFLFPRLEDQIRRRLRVPPMTVRSAVLAGITAICLRLGLALLATAIAGEWAGIPWGRWLPIVLFLALSDTLIGIQHTPPDVPRRPAANRAMGDWTALLSTMEQTSDVEQLADHTRRWFRLAPSASFGAVFAATLLTASALVSPTAFGDLPTGSIVLLALLFYELGETIVYSGSLVDIRFISRQARYDHELFWPSPADSPEVQRAMRPLVTAPIFYGLVVTLGLVLAASLVSWSSPMAVTLAVSLGAACYLVTIYTALRHRSIIKKIVQRARDRHLGRLQNEINLFRSRYTQLSQEESERLRGLIDLHHTIRDAPASPTTTYALSRAAAGLIVPTIMFVITVLGEVSAERFLDAVLP